jgi:hypothetical protein
VDLLALTLTLTPVAAARCWAQVDLGGQTGLARVRTLWTGVGATLARDVPFSAIYWGSLEPIRGALLPRDPTRQQVGRGSVSNRTRASYCPCQIGLGHLIVRVK